MTLIPVSTELRQPGGQLQRTQAPHTPRKRHVGGLGATPRTTLDLVRASNRRTKTRFVAALRLCCTLEFVRGVCSIHVGRCWSAQTAQARRANTEPPDLGQLFHSQPFTRICTRRSTPPRWTTGSGPAHSPDGKGESVLSDFKVVMITLVTADCASGCECVLCEILVFRNAPYSSTKLPMWLPRWPSSRIPRWTKLCGRCLTALS